MRLLARIGYTMAGFALVAPLAARAGMPIPAPGPLTFGQEAAAKKTLKNKLSRGKLCGDCQRKKLKMETGIDAPPAPPLPPGQPVSGEVCAACGATAAVAITQAPRRAPARSEASVYMADNAPGRAVVGAEESAGMASVGNDPVPVGMVAPRMASAMPARPAGGPRDSSVIPTSMASDPVSPKDHRRPQILKHLFGLSAIGRERSLERERREEDNHASITYGPMNQSVTDVPASLVYGKGER